MEIENYKLNNDFYLDNFITISGVNPRLFLFFPTIPFDFS